MYKRLSEKNKDLNDADVYESDNYIEGVSKYIEKDFINFRLINKDNTIGSMVVCRSNTQARLVHYWFKRNSKITTGLVLSDCEDTSKQNEINILNQLSFRENGYPDILIVHFMPTTGYDVERLKKIYLLREGDLLSANGTEIKPMVFDDYTE